MSYLFDTNIVSELRRQERANVAVWDWSLTIPMEDVFISSISLLELERGVLKAEVREAGSGRALRSWMNAQVLPTYGTRVLPVTAEVALRAASLIQSPTIELADQLIAATAMVHGLTLVTRNTRHFTHTGVSLLNPFTP